MDYEKINTILMKILERKYGILIEPKVVKKEDSNGKTR